MSKQHRDFVTYVRNGVEINALVAFSRVFYTSATQTAPASSAEHLTVVYLDPNVGGGVPTGEALRNSIKIQMDVPPLADGLVNGWFDSCRECGGGPCKLDNTSGDVAKDSEGEIKQGPEVTSDQIAALLFEEIKSGEDLTVPDGANLGIYFKVLSDVVRALKNTNNNLEAQVEKIGNSLDASDKLVQANAWIEQQTEKLSAADKLATEQDQQIAALKATVETKEEQVSKLLADINMLESKVQELEPKVPAQAKGEDEIPVSSNDEPTAFNVGDKVRFAVETGNDTEVVHAISGTQVGEGENPQVFYKLEGDEGGLYLPSSLVAA